MDQLYIGIRYPILFDSSTHLDDLRDHGPCPNIRRLEPRTAVFPAGRAIRQKE